MSLIRRGQILLDFDVIDNWDVELEEMNKKQGEKVENLSIQVRLFIRLLGYIRIYFHLPSLQTDRRCS